MQQVPIRLSAALLAAWLTHSLPAQLTWRKAGDQPAARAGQLAFFDSARGRVTVFGGQDSPSTYASDCWQFDGGAWVQLTTQPTAPRGYGACCEDPLEYGGGLVFGGNDSSGFLTNATLRWNRDQHQFDTLSPSASPPPRWITAMAYDGNRHRAVLFGGGDAGGLLGDTWEFDGTNWQQRFPTQSPPARANHVLAYDAARNRVVLFGGHDFMTRDDTWVYDGNTWTDVSAASRPAAVHNAMMAFDAARAVVVLFGGKNDSGTVNNSHWEWNGTSWSGPMAPTFRPAAREQASLTWDSQRRKLVLFGGNGQSGTPLQDTWELDATGWAQRGPLPMTGGSTAFARSEHAAAYSSNRGRMVVFGGNTSSGTLGDTGETNGSAWANRVPATAPAPRFGAKMAYDSYYGRCYLFGGAYGSGFTDNAVWAWNGVNWTSTQSGLTPFARTGHGLTYDSGRRRLVMFGGNTQNGNNNETWEYDPQAGTWAARTPPVAPAARTGHAMAYHAGDSGTYLFGGLLQTGSHADHLYFWNGTTWTPLLPASRPPAVANAAMCYDAQRNRLVMFGGNNGSFVNQDVYEYNGTIWQMRPPVSAARPAGRTGASLVWDSKNQRCVLHGGNAGVQFFSDVWEWDGTALTWTLRPHSGVPEPRDGHGLNFDAARGRTVLFGGYDGARVMDDTWEWDGMAWTPKVTITGPDPSWGTVTAFEQQSGKTILFGGRDAAGGVQGNTWQYDGTVWAQLLVSSPSPRNNHSMVSLAPAPGVVLFGGNNNFGPLGDMQLWNGTTWTMLPSGPPARDLHAMACDRQRNKLVLFGGRDAASNYFNDTWEFSLPASAWIQRQPATSPSGRWSHGMAFDAGRGRVVLNGGHFNFQPLGDLWEWDGTNWQQRTPETRPPQGTWGSQLAFDPVRGRCVTFGGQAPAGPTNGMHELYAPIDMAGRGNTANPSPMRFYSQPVLGQPLRLGFALPQGVGFYLLGFGPSQQPLFILGAPPLCETGNAYATLVTFLVTGAGEPNFAWNVPNTPLIQGVTLVFQGASMIGNCFRASDALQVQFR